MACLVAVGVGAAPNAVAATSNSIYSYTLANYDASSVANEAAANTAVRLQLVGNWGPGVLGVEFSGNRVSSQSVAYARPSTGNTINVGAGQAVGVAIKFRYTAPVGRSCFTDSPNLTQIGRFGTGLSQVKLQLSNCQTTPGSVRAQCRIAGAQSTTSQMPKTATRALLNGATYVVHCYEGPKVLGGRTLVMKTTQVGSTTTTDQFTVAAPGAITSTGYLSIANKYPLPSAASNNTDQYVGDVAKVSYCQGASLLAASSCLGTEIPGG